MDIVTRILSYEPSYAWILVCIFCSALVWSSPHLQNLDWDRLRITSPTKKTEKNGSDSYANLFPPSQRRLLGEVSSELTSNAALLDKSTIASGLLGLTEEFDSVGKGRTIYSGLTIADVQDLGSFPDYATLSEVPSPKPLEEFDTNYAKARPYRPFRWPYHQTMGIHKMDPDFWIELDDSYKEQIQIRQDIHRKHGMEVMQNLPGSKLACKELCEMVVQFLCARYPKLFERDGQTFTNHVLGKVFDTSTFDPLSLLLENVPEDFAIMIRDPETGTYKFRAGLICASTGWNLGTKIGMGLPDIHLPVPDYKEKMQLSMDRFFTKMSASKPVQRGAWGFEVGKHLYTPPDDPDLRQRDSQDPSLRPEDLFLRVDWQTLRRLPLSGAIVFNFKVFFTPVTDLKDEPYIPSLALKIFTKSKENLLRYKEVYHTEHILKPLLEEYEKYQVENGIIEESWEHQTLSENPFFPGWRAKWARANDSAH